MRTLKASTEGLKKIRKAREEKGWAIDNPHNQRWLREASKILEPKKNWEEIEHFAVSIGTWKRFLKGEAIKVKTFQAFCQVLELNWEEVIRGSADTLQIWNVEKNKRLMTLSEPLHSAHSITYSPDSVKIAFCNDDQLIQLWDTNTNESRWLRELEAKCMNNKLIFNKSVKGESLTMVASTVVSNQSSTISLEEWMDNPPVGTEWVNGKLIDKHSMDWVDEEVVERSGMTLKHSRIQSKLSFSWRSYMNSSGQGGEVYTEVPCRTNKQGRSPDVAYLTPELVAQYGDNKVLPQSFPLSAEIVSPTDLAEDVIAKAAEYLQSGGEEVWLVFPESRWIIVVTQTQRLVFVSGEVVNTQAVLLGFSIAVDELLA